MLFSGWFGFLAEGEMFVSLVFFFFFAVKSWVLVERINTLFGAAWFLLMKFADSGCLVVVAQGLGPYSTSIKKVEKEIKEMAKKINDLCGELRIFRLILGWNWRCSSIC